jgi:hypothetical protein
MTLGCEILFAGVAEAIRGVRCATSEITTSFLKKIK